MGRLGADEAERYGEAVKLIRHSGPADLVSSSALTHRIHQRCRRLKGTLDLHSTPSPKEAASSDMHMRSHIYVRIRRAWPYGYFPTHPPFYCSPQPQPFPAPSRNLAAAIGRFVNGQPQRLYEWEKSLSHIIASLYFTCSPIQDVQEEALISI